MLKPFLASKGIRFVKEGDYTPNNLWKMVQAGYPLTNDFIREHANNIDFPQLVRNRVLDECILREFESRVVTSEIVSYQSLPEDLLRKHWNLFHFSALLHYQRIPESLILEKKLTFQQVLETQDLSEEYLSLYVRHRRAHRIPKTQIVSLDFVQKYGLKPSWQHMTLACKKASLAKKFRVDGEYVYGYMFNLRLYRIEVGKWYDETFRCGPRRFLVIDDASSYTLPHCYVRCKVEDVFNCAPPRFYSKAVQVIRVRAF